MDQRKQTSQVALKPIRIMVYVNEEDENEDDENLFAGSTAEEEGAES